MDEIDWNDFKKSTIPQEEKKKTVPKTTIKDKLHPIVKPPEPQPIQPKAFDPFTDFVNQFTHREEKSLKKGDVEIDARLDLHGLFVEDAHQRVRRFIQTSYQENKRNLLIITGKGARGDGVIKAEFKHWLENHDVNPLIMRLELSHLKHGGGGAYKQSKLQYILEHF